MDNSNEKIALEKLEKALGNLKDKNFKVYFFVFDSKGMPSGSLTYIYETALTLKKLGYNVEMLYTGEEFVGVREWLGDDYADIPHQNADNGKVAVTPADFLFIPEIYANVMSQTMNMPCKRVVMLQNTNYLFDTIAIATTFDKLKIYDCITTNKNLEKRAKVWFPNVKTYIVRPSVDDIFFKKDDTPQKLIVNIVSKTHSDINSIVKPFYLKYPLYKWVTFKDLREMSKTDFANALKEGTITLWLDDKTDFGHSALEAMAAKNFVIGKVPENEPDWLLDENGVVKDNGLWFYKNDTALDMLASVIETVLNDAIPESIYDETLNTVEYYSKENMENDIQEVYVEGIFKRREEELNTAYAVLKNKLEKE